MTVTLRASRAPDGEGETTEMTILHERLPAAYYREGARRAWAVIAAKRPAVMADQSRKTCRARASGDPSRPGVT